MPLQCIPKATYILNLYASIFYLENRIFAAPQTLKQSAHFNQTCYLIISNVTYAIDEHIGVCRYPV